MKIAILGGSFDPPHLGHLFIAQQVQELLHMDQVWLMPAYHHPFARNLTDEKKRLAMTRLLQTDVINVSDFEIQYNHTSYTIDTLEQLKEKYPEDTFYWITGSDQLEHFQKYKDWQKIIKEHNLIIFPREWMMAHLEDIVKEKLILKTIPRNVIVLQNKNVITTNISSTKIRERLQTGLSIHYLVPKGIEQYIKKHRLYEK